VDRRNLTLSIPLQLDEGLVDSSLPLIEVSHCSVLFAGHAALDDVSFKLHAGERWALVGANGSGKTLLLKLLRGDVWPTPMGNEERTYALDGRPSREPAGSKERIAYVGPERQDKYVRYGWDLTVLQVVTTGLFDEDIPLTRPTRVQQARVARMLRRFGLWSLRERHLLRLSYGQRRLVLIARAFVTEARVLLLDEVCNGLDTKTRAKLQRALEAPRSKHTWVLTTHRPKQLPRNLTHAACLVEGRIVFAGRARDAAFSAFAHQERSKTRASALPTFKVGQNTARPELAAFSHPRSSRAQARGGAWLMQLRAVNLYRDYRPVVRDLDWTVRRGEHWAILGPNGSGKSTVLSLLYGDMHPALGGTIERQGVPSGTRIESWKQRVGWISPELQADHYLAKTIEEIVISGRYSSVGLNEPPTPSDRQQASRWLEFFGITHLRARGPRAVSYGQMRLALFARAMINRPELLLLDEPCTGLDGDARAHVLSVLEQLASSGVQIIMAVHDREDIIPAVKHVLRIGRGGKVVTE
jgi:molybdate transport system ATP-binding protein